MSGLITGIVRGQSNNFLVQSFDSNAFGDGAVLGCDFAGTVKDVGKDVGRAAKGDVIAGLVWGGMNSVSTAHCRC